MGYEMERIEKRYILKNGWSLRKPTYEHAGDGEDWRRMGKTSEDRSEGTRYRFSGLDLKTFSRSDSERLK